MKLSGLMVAPWTTSGIEVEWTQNQIDKEASSGENTW